MCLTRPSKGTTVTPVTPVAPETFQIFQSFITFQPFQAILQILQCSSISRESTQFQHSPIRIHILHILQFYWFPQKTPPSTSWTITNITNIHSSKKGRCCDIGQTCIGKRCQDDIFPRIELFPLSFCQVTILITRMTFNSFLSCLMSKVSIEITSNTSKWHEHAKQWNGNSQISSHK